MKFIEERYKKKSRPFERPALTCPKESTMKNYFLTNFTLLIAVVAYKPHIGKTDTFKLCFALTNAKVRKNLWICKIYLLNFINNKLGVYIYFLIMQWYLDDCVVLWKSLALLLISVILLRNEVALARHSQNKFCLCSRLIATFVRN